MKHDNHEFLQLLSRSGLARGGEISSYEGSDAVKIIAEAAMVSRYTVRNWIQGQTRVSEKNLILLRERLKSKQKI